jgi:hypothetical protein
MISAKMIENLLDDGFSKSVIESIIANDFYSLEEKLREDMIGSLDNLTSQCAVRKIADTL